jgi:GPH family glycoside/pentoside/hexuronide:cation symporter
MTHPKLPTSVKLAFGAGDLGPAVVTAISGFFLLEFLINVAGVRPAAAGTILLLAKIWDAVNDPVVGWLTDRTRSRWGRRRPWLLFGALPFGIAFFLHWVVPPLDETGKFLYYLLVAILLDTSLTVVGVPYTSLTPELTDDYDERTSLNTYRFGFSILGGVLAAFLHTQIDTAFSDNRALGALISVGFWSVLSVLGLWWTFWGTRGRAEHPPAGADGPGFWNGMRIAFSNRAFVYATLIYLLSWLAIQLVQANLFLFARDWVGMPGDQFGFVLLGLQIMAFIAMLGWARLSERIGKQAVYVWGVLVFTFALLALFFIPPGATWMLFVIAPIGGIGVAVGYLVPWSLLPDVIDSDELETGLRREGVFYGVFVLLQKLGLSLGLFLTGQVLEWVGYIPAPPGGAVPVQPDQVLLALRILVGPVGAAILLISLIFIRLYPITRERHQAIKLTLATRAATGQPGQDK